MMPEDLIDPDRQHSALKCRARHIVVTTLNFLICDGHDCRDIAVRHPVTQRVVRSGRHRARGQIILELALT